MHLVPSLFILVALAACTRAPSAKPAPPDAAPAAPEVASASPGASPPEPVSVDALPITADVDAYLLHGVKKREQKF